MIPKGRAGGWGVIPPIFINIINTKAGRAGKILQNITNVNLQPLTFNLQPLTIIHHPLSIIQPFFFLFFPTFFPQKLIILPPLILL